MKFLNLQMFAVFCEILFVFLAYSAAQTTSNEYITFASNVTYEEDCECPCDQIPSNSTTKTLEEIQDEIEEIVQKLKINKEYISATTRKKTSAKDDRPSAQSIGYVGIICLVVSIGGIVVLDLDAIWKDIKIAKSRIKEIVNSSNESVTRQVVTLRPNIPDGDADIRKPLNTDSFSVEPDD